MDKTIVKKLETISAINVTPFRKDKSIDWNALESNVFYLLEQQMEVIVPCGNTGEFYALTVEEAKEENRRVTELVNGRALVVAGIGYSVETAIDMGESAKAAGADAIMIHMPIHPYMTDEGTVDYFRNIIKAVDMPALIYFKNPSLKDDVLKKLTNLDQLVGVKYAINDLPRFAQIVQETPSSHNITWICGTAEKWAPFFWAAGAKGFTSGLVNLYPEISLDMIQALRNENWQQVWDLWQTVVPFENLRARKDSGNNVVVIKEALNQLDFPAGITREPVSSLEEPEKQEVANLLTKWGVTANRFTSV